MAVPNSLKTTFILVLFCLLVSTRAGAQNCINGPYEANQELLDSFNENQSLMKQAYLHSKVQHSNDTNGEISEFAEILRNCGLKKDVTANLVSPLLQPRRVAKSCITASLKRASRQQAYACSYPAKMKNHLAHSEQSEPLDLGAAKRGNIQCITQDYIDYLHFAVNLAAKCLSSEGAVDTQSLFRKINAETGFNLSLASEGGIGLMQITGYCAREFTTKLGNGHYIFREVINSSNPACEPFKKIAENDLKRSPSTAKENYCAWVNPGDGLARNLLYGLGYQVHMRKTKVLPIIEDKFPHLADNKEVVREMETVTFGRGGIKQLKWILQKFRFSKKTTAAQVKTAISNESEYNNETEGKMREILCIQNGITNKDECANANFTPADLAGNKCVSK